jgi:hypothetical protein
VNRRQFLCAGLALPVAACAENTSTLVPNQGETVEVGYIAAWQSFDLEARLGQLQPANYIVWLWQQREALRRENRLAEGVTITLKLYESGNRTPIWTHRAREAIVRQRIPATLALRSSRFVAEVQGHRVVQAEHISHRVDGNTSVWISGTGLLRESVSSRRAFVDGFGIPLILERNPS